MTSPKRTCTVLYFAWVREKMGRARDELDVPPSIETVADLLTWLADKGDEYALAFADTTAIRVAIDQAHTTHDAKLGTPREIALFPPVTGG